MAEKKFLAYMENLEPINTKLDTVINDTTTLKSTTSTIDTTTKDTNSKVDNMKATVDTINTSVEAIKNNPSSGEKWVYSGTTGTEKTLINKVDFLVDQEMELVARTDTDENRAKVIGFFVPKVSGIHNITITADTLNANEDAIIGVATYNELMFAIINLNILESTAQSDDLDGTNELFGRWEDASTTSSTYGIFMGRNLLLSYINGDHFNKGTTNTIIKYCTKNEPVYILAADNETTDITLWECTVTVKYRETEPYE